MKPLLLAALVLLYTPGAGAEEPPPILPGQPDYEPALILHIDDLELLPIAEHRWILMTMDNRVLFEKLEDLGERYRDLSERAKEEGERAWLAAQREELRGELARISAKVRKLVAKQGVDAFAWNRWNQIRARYKGPRRAARFAHAQVIYNTPTKGPGWTLMNRLVHSVDAAQVVLATAIEAAERADGEEGERRGQPPHPTIERLQERIEQIEWRFWRVFDWVLDIQNRVGTRRLLPMAYQSWDDPMEHARLLLGLTTGDIGRIRALAAEIEAQSAPDEALIEANERIVDDESKPEAEREQAAQAMRAAEKRLARHRVDLFARLKRIAGGAGWLSLQGVPPRLDAGIRMEGLDEALEQIEFRPDQVTRLAPIAKRYREVRETTERELEKLEGERKEMGPDSPQMEMMEMRAARFEASMGMTGRDLMRRVVLKVLDPQQVVDWVLGVSR